MSGDKSSVLCYNRGCGQSFDPQSNPKDGCVHHPGVPVFHDAYKGWSCCSKKTTDFTEFLNIKGCTTASHSNVKPPEPEKPKEEVIVEPPKEEVRAPVYVPKPRPPADTPLIDVPLTINNNLAKTLESLAIKCDAVESIDTGVVTVGTMCNNKGCKTAFEGPQSDEDTCLYHEGELNMNAVIIKCPLMSI